jgi:hypothetical protein
MFVQSIKVVDNATKLKKAKRKTADGNFSVFLNDSEDDQKSVNEVYSAPSLNSMLFLQDVNSQPNITKNNYERGKDILDGLENYRKAILSGGSSNDLQKIANQLKENRAKSEDLELENLIDEIELRAAVEAAKREVEE